MATDKLAAEMLAKLSAKDADWQLQCDGWVKSASDLDQPITAETEAILRRNSYGEAATAIRALLEERSAREATLTALEAENKRLREALTVERKLSSALHADLREFLGIDAVICEGCNAPMTWEEDVATTADVNGCWGYVADCKDTKCYRYRTEQGIDRSWPPCELADDLSRNRRETP